MNRAMWCARNPFEDAYLREELEFYGPATYEKDGLLLVTRGISELTRLDDYLNINLRSELPPLPMLFIDNILWMSLTPMELQAQHLAIQKAERIAGTAGLGLGHFTLRAAGLEHVEEVHVFERDPRVIECFTTVHGEREGVKEKVHYHIGDAREELKKGPQLDSLYVDIYQTLCSDRVIEDLKELRGLMRSPADYTWWGSELGLLNCIARKLLGKGRMRPILRDYFAMWACTPLAEQGLRTLDELYCKELLEVARPYWMEE